MALNKMSADERQWEGWNDDKRLSCNNKETMLVGNIPECVPHMLQEAFCNALLCLLRCGPGVCVEEKGEWNLQTVPARGFVIDSRCSSVFCAVRELPNFVQQSLAE